MLQTQLFVYHGLHRQQAPLGLNHTKWAKWFFAGVCYNMLDRDNRLVLLDTLCYLLCYSDMIIASLCGFKVIFLFSSEPKMFYWRSRPTVECVIMVYHSSQSTGFSSLLNLLFFYSAAAWEAKWSLKWGDVDLVTEKTLHGVYRWEQAGEQNVAPLCFQWLRLVKLRPPLSWVGGVHSSPVLSGLQGWVKNTKAQCDEAAAAYTLQYWI